jgi:hypothetical protein
MTFQQIESSKEFRAPIELYEFWYGSEPSQQFFYTFNETGDIERGGKVYTHIPIRRENIKTDGKFDKSQLNVRIPVNTPLSNLFLPYPPPGVVQVRIWQGHHTDGDDDFVTVWFGRCLSNSREGNETVLTCDNTIISHKRLGLRRMYSHGCTYVLYDQQTCKADKEAAGRDVVVQVVEMGTGKIELPGGWNLPYAPQHFVRGLFRWESEQGTEWRSIIKADEASITIGGMLRGLEFGETVRIYLGCAHTTDHCTGLHENINNYGGQPQIPFKNPVRQHPYW